MKKKNKLLLLKKKYFFLSYKNKYYYKKKKFLRLFVKNLYKINKLFNFIYYINIFKYKKNVFINYSKFQNGNILYKASCGSFIKRKSLRKTFFGVQHLFRNFLLNDKLSFVNTKKFFFIFNIRAFFLKNGFKRLLKNFFNNTNERLRVIKINKIILKPHNGIRKRKKKRK